MLAEILAAIAALQKLESRAEALWKSIADSIAEEKDLATRRKLQAACERRDLSALRKLLFD